MVLVGNHPMHPELLPGVFGNCLISVSHVARGGVRVMASASQKIQRGRQDKVPSWTLPSEWEVSLYGDLLDMF